MGDRQRAHRLRALPGRMQRQRHDPRGSRPPRLQPQQPRGRPRLDLRQGSLLLPGAACRRPRDEAAASRAGHRALRRCELGRRARGARAPRSRGRRLGGARALRLGDGRGRLCAVAARAQGIRLAPCRAARGDEHGTGRLPSAAVRDRRCGGRRRYRRRPGCRAGAGGRPLDPRGTAKRRRGHDVRPRGDGATAARRRRRRREGAGRQAEGAWQAAARSRARGPDLVRPRGPRRGDARAARAGAGPRGQTGKRRVLPARHAQRPRRRGGVGGSRRRRGGSTRANRLAAHLG